MCRRQCKTLGIIVLGFSVIAFTAGAGLCQTEGEIFIWTARTLGVDQELEMPPINWVDQAELQAVFVNSTRVSYLRWEIRLGEKQAQVVMDQYLADIVGLYEPKTDEIYVGTFLGPCRRMAILAHEFTHFFQQNTGGEVMAWGEDAEAAMKMVREMEAYKIERIFEQTFCTTDTSLDPTGE